MKPKITIKKCRLINVIPDYPLGYRATISDDAGYVEAEGDTKEEALKELILDMWKSWGKDAKIVEKLREALHET